jgi:hypothetical protein
MLPLLFYYKGGAYRAEELRLGELRRFFTLSVYKSLV